jgi:hypothetical protein
VHAIQDGDDLVDGDRLCIWYRQVGTTDADDFDALIYEKPVAADPRFSFERWIGGSLDVRATFTLTITAGSEYRLACIATADVGNDLGLANSTLRIMVGADQGTDAVASANHDDTEVHTELWRGCAPSAASLRRSMNYVWNMRAWTRCLTNEEVTAPGI